MKIYYDGNSPDKYKDRVSGFTTNTSFASQSGYDNYEKYIKDYLKKTDGKPCSFQIWSDEDSEIIRQSIYLSSISESIFVKIPIIKCDGKNNIETIKKILDIGLKVNITAIHTVDQINLVSDILPARNPVIISVFAGGMTDAGQDPQPIVSHAVNNSKNAEVLWAGCQTNLHIIQAEKCGCHIITVPDAVINKMNRMELDLETTSLLKVKKFMEDASFIKIEIK